MNRAARIGIFSLSVLIFCYAGIGHVLGRTSDDKAYKSLTVYGEVLQKIQQDYVDDPNMRTVTAGALHGLLESLDPQSSYLTPREYENAGYLEESRAWREWLLRAVAGSASQMQIMYGVHGERRLNEEEIPWLAGYENSKPVRIGNAAHNQLQLDVFGEVMDALHQARQSGHPRRSRACA